MAAQAAVGRREKIFVYGTDYDTKDGTGVRDYIHIADLADAHLKALDYLMGGGASTILNCGYGSGYSVREVLDTVLELSERKFPVIDEPRRAGDPPKLIARADNIREVLGWTPKMNDLHTIVKTSIDWEKKLAGA